MIRFLKYVLLLLPTSLVAQTTVINWTNPQQTVRGFGGANEAQFANMSNSSLVFGNGSGQLGLTVLRTGVANGSNMPGSCTTVNSGCAGLISDMQAVVANGGIVISAPWSPPASMKSNGIGPCSPGSGILNSGSYSAFATYLSNYITSVKNFAGVTLYSVAIQNEPDFCPTYDGALYSGSQLQTFIKNNLGPTLTGAGQTSTLISLSDSAHYSGLSSIAGPCAGDSTCNAFVGAYSMHPYDATVSGSTATNMPLPSGLSTTKDYWATEMSQGTNYGPACGSYSSFTNTISDGLCWDAIWDQLLNNNVNMVVYWQINDFGGTAPATATNGSLISNAAAGSVVAKRAYVLAQYAKFIRPGYVRIDATRNPVSSVNISSYKNSNTAVIVASNFSSSSSNVTFNIINAPTFSTMTPTITSASQNIVTLSNVVLSGNSFTYSLPAQSVVTFVGTGSGGSTFTLSTATAGSGSGTITGCAGTYASGAAYSCSVSASAGSTISSVSGCGGSGTTTFSGTMPASNCTVTATFTATGTTFTSATCNQADVNTLINGPTHVAVNGDTIIIKAGTCTWTSGISVSGVGITIQGQGSTPNSLPSQFTPATSTTNITQNTTQALFSVSAVPQGQLMRYSLMTLAPQAGLTGESPAIQTSGICNTSGCPNIRVDNISFGDWTNDPSAATTIVNNMFGVYDHNFTIGSGEGAPAALAQISFSAWKGVGANGDNSFASPDTFGTNQALYIENNTLSNARGTENDVGFNGLGGDRVVVRYNILNNASAIGLFNSHGTAWTGRDRGSRSKEVYRNTLNCSYSGGCGTGSFNSGTGYVFENTYTATSPGFFNQYFTLDSPRRWRAVAAWGYCDGTGNYDANDGTTYASGTVTSSTSSNNMTDTSKTWTSGQWTLSGNPYSVHNSTQNYGGEINSNSATTYTFSSGGPFGQTWTAGNAYQILRASVCLDQAGRSGGTLLSGTSGPNGGPTPTGNNNQTLDPIHEWADTHTGGFGTPVTTQVISLVANRDWYAETSNQTAQTSPTSPFNGSSGDGHGTLANRPTSCTTGVGYFATDQGNWNLSGGEQGVLYICSSTNTWSVAYTPFTYPNPLISGGGPPTAAAPTFSLSTGGYPYGTGVTISTTSSGCSGSLFWGTANPPTNSGNSFFITANSTYFAQVIGCSGFSNSGVSSIVYSVTTPVTSSSQGGTINGGSIL